LALVDRFKGSGVMRDRIRWFLNGPVTGQRHRSSRLSVLFILGSLVACGVPLPSVQAEDAAALFRTGRYAESAAAAAEEADKNPFSENLYLLRIRAELELGRYAEAAKALDAALERLPQSVRLRCLGLEVCRFNRQADREKLFQTEIAELIQRFSWRYSDAPNQIAIGRLMLKQGVDPKTILTKLYNPIKRREPGLIDAPLASGDLALDKHDYQLAGEAFQQAAKIDPASAEAQLGIAKAFSSSDDKITSEAITAALSANPKHVETLLFVADHHIDSERYADAEATLAEVAAINPHHPRALAYKAVLAHLRNQPDQEKGYREAALKFWPENPEVDYQIGRKLSQKYRFTEGEQSQRRALEIDPGYLPARSQLAQDLLRLGREEEGLKLAEEVYEQDGYNVYAHNLVTLQESLARFRTLEEGGLLLRMESQEAEIYGRRVLELLKRARQDLAAKYEVDLPSPIIVEMFPRQEDFAIRTFGMPGGAGFLGVCFGTVITANSPASQGRTPACWEATLWHEFCHVVTLNKTRNKMPRWLSEGISVYEERQADPRWGQTMTPQYREMILGDDFVPVSKLSGAFLSPKSGLHLQFAYYESSLAVQYLVETHGFETLKKILVDLGVGMPINEALARHTGSIEELDARFTKYARDAATAMAPLADWSPPELPKRASLELLGDWLKQHPHNYAALRQQAVQLIAAKRWAEAKQAAEQMVSLFPRDESADSPYAMLARIHRELGEAAEERLALETLAEMTDDRVDLLDRLTQVALDAKDWDAARKYGLRWLAINPLKPEPHRRLARAAAELKDFSLAVESRTALLTLDPFDKAQSHYELAAVFHAQGEIPAARRHVLAALEETPRFRDAQQLLLKIVKASPAELAPTVPSSSAEPEVPPPPPLPVWEKSPSLPRPSL